MVSLIAASSAHFMVSYPRFSCLNAPIVLIMSPPKRHHTLCPKRKRVKQKKQNQLLFEFSDYCGCGVVRMCKRWEGEGDSALELEVLEFMKNSKNSDMFPSRGELIEAGRVDLAEAILKRGGWMSMGWEENDAEKEEIEDRLASNGEFSLEKYSQNGCQGEGRSGSELNEGKHLDGNSSPSSSGRSLELAAEDSGIEGILSRLERQRSLSFGFNMGENGNINQVSGDFVEDEKSAITSKNGDSCHPERTERASLRNDGHMHRDNGSNISSANVFSSSLKADTWRTWIIQRAGISDTEFEAAEIEFGRDTNGRTVDSRVGPIIADTKDVDEPLNNTNDSNSCVQEITQSDVKTRLQHLELELSSALISLRSNTDDLSNKAKEYFSEELRQLSDASEFQENELMNAQDKLRSLRAKLAVLEGKKALAIIDGQKILDEKQKRIDNVRRALQLLRTTCIVWPNSGSEVLLAGSYDGWATQRKMERSSTGIFSLCLKLYPGKYEIKFIVDGSWKIDPLRPIVSHNGFENNLLIID